MAGRLPMPAGVWSRYRSVLSGSLDEKLPRAGGSQRGIDANGAANQAAIAACMTEFLFNVLNDEPGRAVLFLPVTRGGASRCAS